MQQAANATQRGQRTKLQSRAPNSERTPPLPGKHIISASKPTSCLPACRPPRPTCLLLLDSINGLACAGLAMQLAKRHPQLCCLLAAQPGQRPRASAAAGNKEGGGNTCYPALQLGGSVLLALEGGGLEPLARPQALRVAAGRRAQELLSICGHELM